MEKLTEKERDLIETIRLYRKSKHNPSQALEWYIQKLFHELMYE